MSLRNISHALSYYYRLQNPHFIDQVIHEVIDPQKLARPVSQELSVELVTLPVSSPQRLPPASKTGERLPVLSTLSGVLISHSHSLLRWFPGGTFPRNSLGVLGDPRLVGSVLRFCRLRTNCPLGLRGLFLPSEPSVC